MDTAELRKDKGAEAQKLAGDIDTLCDVDVPARKYQKSLDDKLADVNASRKSKDGLLESNQLLLKYACEDADKAIKEMQDKKPTKVAEPRIVKVNREPSIALWNLARLAEALLPLIDSNVEEAAKMATASLKKFALRFEAAHLGVMRAKLGLRDEKESDAELVDELLGLLAEHHPDHTIFFRDLASGKVPFDAWAEKWRARNPDPETMRRANPAFIPRNHRVEEAIEAATDGDFKPFETLVRVLARPYDDQPESAHLMEAPGKEQHDYVTFCGT